ncbi:MAG: GNAT family N-acetyltransferase [Pseudomonadota bacterium]
MTPFQAAPDYPQWDKVARLIHGAFAYMAPLLGHPARAASVTPEQLAAAADSGTAFLIEDGDKPIACLFARASRDFPGARYLGWLAVADSHRSRGLARLLIASAEDEARILGHPALTLDTGRVLTDLHGFFQQAGFDPVPGNGDVISFRKALD